MRAKTLLRCVARVLRHAPDRALHPRRRAAARRRLSTRDVPASVVFVCLGNICRSPFAASAFEQALPSALRNQVSIASAGFLRPGRSAPLEAVEVAAAAGIDLTPHRSAVLTRDAVRRADLVVVMDRLQQRQVCRFHGRREEDVLVLGDLDPLPIDTRAIRDPYDQPAAVFEASYGRIERCVGQLASIFAAPDREQRATAPTALPLDLARRTPPRDT